MTAKTTTTHSSSKLDTSNPKADAKSAGTPLPKPVRSPVDESEKTRATNVDTKDAGGVHTLPQTPNPSDPSAITGTAVPLTSSTGTNPADIGATGDLTGTPASRSGIEQAEVESENEDKGQQTFRS